MKPPKPSPLSSFPQSKVFDIAKPGASAPSSTTRPLIVTNRPIIQDPMVTPANSEPSPEQTIKPSQTIPVLNAKKPEMQLGSDAPEGKSQPTDEATKEEAVEEPHKEASLDKEPATVELENARKASEAEARRQAEYQTIIDSQKYFVPINAARRKRTMSYAVIGAIVVIVVALGCLDIMLDAGIIDLPSVPHTNFISP